MMAFCFMCGKSIAETAVFCPYCGSKTEGAVVPAIPAAEPAAAPVAIAEQPVPDYISERYPQLSREQESPATTGAAEPAAAPVGYTPTMAYNPDGAAGAVRTAPGHTPTAEYTPGVYRPVGYQPETVQEEPKKKREMPWQSDPRAKEAAEKASAAATETVSGMMDAYKKALSIAATKPIMLWGLSLLYNLLTVLAVVFSLLPIIWLPINLVLQLGVSSIYLSGIRGNAVNSDALFAGFKNFFKNAGGMGWRALWIIIWGIIVGTVAGIAAAAFGHGTYILEAGKYLDFGLLKQILAVIEIFLAAVALIAAVVLLIGKSYSYSFVPYILLTEDGVSGTQALRRAMKLARGWKLKMFAADFAVILAYGIIVAIFAGLNSLTDGFFLFKLLLILVGAVGALFGTLFFGLLHAAFYELAAGKEA